MFDPGPGFRAEPVAVCPQHETELLQFLRGVYRNQYRFLAGIGLIMVARSVALVRGFAVAALMWGCYPLICSLAGGG